MPDEFGNFLGIYEPFKAAQLKALTPHPGGGSTYAPSYSSWGEWDRDLRGAAFMGTRTDYSAKVGDPRASSLIMAGVRWAGSTLPEAPLLVKQSDGTKGASEVIPNHPLVALWRRPNPYYSGSTLMKAFAFSWITKGDVYIRKVWNDSRTKVVELWYEPHWLIRPRWIGDGQSAYIAGEMDSPDKFITYYELDRGAKKYRLETSDVIHFRDGLNAETRCGQNGIAAILREVFGDNEAANYFAQLMANGGVPKFILSADPELELDGETQRRVAAEAQRQSEGDNRGKVMVLSGVKPFKLPWSPEEMDMRASRYMSEDRFAAVTGIPAVEMELGAGRESSIYNNVRQASERATERFLVPAWNHIAEELTVQLLPDFGENPSLYVTHDLSKVRSLAEDDTAHSERVVKEYQGGIITLNEARSMRNMEPIEGGDIFKETQPRVMEEPPGKPDLRLVKSLPEESEIDEAVSWFDSVAPPAARGILDAEARDKSAKEAVASIDARELIEAVEGA